MTASAFDSNMDQFANENDYSFLRHLINEEIYLINQEKQDEETTTMASEPHGEDIPGASTESATETGPGNRYQNTTVILLNYASYPDIPDNMRVLLTKILQSVKLDPDRVEKVFSEQLKAISPNDFMDSTVIAFHYPPTENLKERFPEEPYQVKEVDGNRFMCCHSLEVIDGDKSLKRNLWNQLQELYGPS